MTQVSAFDYRVIMDILETLDCSKSLMVAILYRYQEFDTIIKLSFDPMDYNELGDARDSLQAIELLRKHESLPTSVDKASVALTAFLACEEVCADSNDRIYGSNSHAPQRFVASRKIQSCLQSFNIDSMMEFAGWGPGVTLTLRGRNATPLNKFHRKAEVTQPLYHFIKNTWPLYYPHWEVEPRCFEGNRIVTVPKNAKTDRVIAVEPSLNLFLQKGIGTMIRKALRSCGIDLNDQTRNQKLCKIASETNLLTTVDFSAASDTISFACVHDLFGESDWFHVMDRLRSPRGYIEQENRLIEYNKFSSMGNGYTFELESLIFWALAQACTPEDHPLKNSVSVYGDDVIIPTDCYGAFIELCTFYGFTVNKSKSFSSTYYRESCGVHFWNGIDITPCYNRRSLSQKREKMAFHNSLVRLSTRKYGIGFRDKRWKPVISFLASASELKNPVPLSFGDVGLITSFDSCTPRFCRRVQRGFFVKISVYQTVKQEDFTVAIGLTRLYDLWKRDRSKESQDTLLGNDVLVPRVGRYGFSKSWTPDWEDLGVWI